MSACEEYWSDVWWMAAPVTLLAVAAVWGCHDDDDERTTDGLVGEGRDDD